MNARTLALATASALLAATSTLAGVTSSTATPAPAQAPTAAAAKTCTGSYIRTHTAVRIREQPSTGSKTMRIVPSRHYVWYHTVKENGWYRVGGPLPGDGAWYGYMSPTDPKTGKTISSDGWIEKFRCDSGSRIPNPFPVNSKHGKNVHRR